MRIEIEVGEIPEETRVVIDGVRFRPEGPRDVLRERFLAATARFREQEQAS